MLVFVGSTLGVFCFKFVHPYLMLLSKIKVNLDRASRINCWGRKNGRSTDIFGQILLYGRPEFSFF